MVEADFQRVHNIDLSVALYGPAHKQEGLRRVWVLLRGLPGWGTSDNSDGSNGSEFQGGRTSDPAEIAAFFNQHVTPIREEVS